jgi:hypothetical protein
VRISKQSLLKMEGEISRGLVIRELKRHRTSAQDAISHHLYEVATGADVYIEESDIGAVAAAHYYLDQNQKLVEFIDDMIQVLKNMNKAKCDGERFFLDCTCRSNNGKYTRETTCDPCRERVFERLKAPNMLLPNPLTRSKIVGPAYCYCDYCNARSGGYYRKLRDAFPDIESKRCCKHDSIEKKCTTCLLYFTADQFFRKNL